MRSTTRREFLGGVAAFGALGFTGCANLIGAGASNSPGRLPERVGSLKAGKRADLIMVNTRDVNLAVFSEPAHMLVEAAQPSNVDTVVVDGRILKRRGRLTAIDTEQVASEASAALSALRKRTGWW